MTAKIKLKIEKHKTNKMCVVLREITIVTCIDVLAESLDKEMIREIIGYTKDGDFSLETVEDAQ